LFIKDSAYDFNHRIIGHFLPNSSTDAPTKAPGNSAGRDYGEDDSDDDSVFVGLSGLEVLPVAGPVAGPDTGLDSSA
jgi:hypothetical protein